MKKILTANFLILLSIIQLNSLTFQTSKTSIEITANELKSFDKKDITTERNKDNVYRKQLWSGTSISDILAKYNVTEFEEIRIVASDNYMVRFNQNEINKDDPIIAYIVDGKNLKEEKFRLIASQKRDMFWISSISKIIVDKKVEMFNPETIYVAENLLHKLPLENELEPFKKVTGYFLRNLLEIFPYKNGDYLLMGKDGVKHILDYDKYLSKSVLVKSENGYFFKSPQMPAGMWIKNLGYIQKDDMCIVFTDQFSNMKDVAELVKWTNLPKEIKLITDEKKYNVKFNEDFKELNIEEVKKIEL